MNVESWGETNAPNAIGVSSVDAEAHGCENCDAQVRPPVQRPGIGSLSGESVDSVMSFKLGVRGHCQDSAVVES